jgi:LemA protein
MSDSVVLWLAVAVLLFWAMGAYNRLVRCRSQGIVAFAVLEGLFHQYLELVKTHAPDAQGAEPAVAAWAALAAAADQFKASLRFAHAQPLHAPAMKALRTAHETLFESWTRLRELNADPADPVLLQALQTQWEQLAVRTEMARADFNRLVANYNEAIGQFPALLLAWLFGFKPAQAL